MVMHNNMNYAIKNIKWLMAKHGLTPTTLAQETGAKQSTIYRIINGEVHDPRAKTLQPLASYFKIKLRDFFEKDLTVDSGDTHMVTVAIGDRKVPVINYLQAYTLSSNKEKSQLEKPMRFILTNLALSGAAFAVPITDNAMAPEYRPGDIVVVDPDIKPNPGDCVIASCKSQTEAIMRKYRVRTVQPNAEPVIELIPHNEDYARFSSEYDTIVINGTIVEHRRYPRPAMP